MSTIDSLKLVGAGPIVLVDDDEIDAYLMERFHRRSGLPNSLRVFDCGRDFVDYVTVLEAGDELPSIVFLDINMPTMTGFEVLATVRNYPHLQQMPITVFYSNSDSPADRERARELGCSMQEKFTDPEEGAAFLRRLAEPTAAGEPN